MNNIVDKKIKIFLDELSSSSPTPGGGATAALVGAFSAGLCEMVVNLTLGKDKYKSFESELSKLKEEIISLKDRLTVLLDEDIEAFNQVMSAYKIDKGSFKRHSEIENALKTATEVPLETSRICRRLMTIADRLTQIGNKHAFSDAKSAFFLADAARLSAMENVKINLSSINDVDWTENISSKVAEINRM